MSFSMICLLRIRTIYSSNITTGRVPSSNSNYSRDFK